MNVRSLIFDRIYPELDGNLLCFREGGAVCIQISLKATKELLVSGATNVSASLLEVVGLVVQAANKNGRILSAAIFIIFVLTYHFLHNLSR